LNAATTKLENAYNAFSANPDSPITIYIDNAGSAPSNPDGVIHIPLTWIADADATDVKDMFRLQAGFTMKGWLVSTNQYLKVYNDTENDKSTVQSEFDAKLSDYAPNTLAALEFVGKMVKIVVIDGTQDILPVGPNGGYTIYYTLGYLQAKTTAVAKSKINGLVTDGLDGAVVVPVPEGSITFAKPAKDIQLAQKPVAMMPGTFLAVAGETSRFIPETAVVSCAIFRLS
jgi:hypothetical protein